MQMWGSAFVEGVVSLVPILNASRISVAMMKVRPKVYVYWSVDGTRDGAGDCEEMMCTRKKQWCSEFAYLYPGHLQNFRLPRKKHEIH